MKAGFAKVKINPWVGMPLMGWGRPKERPCLALHDDVCVRALFASHRRQKVLIMGFDLCFLGREDSDRFKGVLGRTLGLLPSNILFNASHTHAGPAVSAYLDMEYEPPTRDYLRQMEAAVVAAAAMACENQREVRIRSSVGRTRLPMNRRQWREGRVVNAPNPAGVVIDSLPLCYLESPEGDPVALLFSIGTHPVVMRQPVCSADYPGVAMDRLDKHLGTPCSLFLQGAGGDSRPRTVGEGRPDWNWNSGWDETLQTGEILAQEVIQALKNLNRVEPDVRGGLVETQWPLEAVSGPEVYQQLLGPGGQADSRNLKQLWASRQLERWKRGSLPTLASILLQGIQLGQGLRLIALEGEPVAPHGLAIEKAFDDGTTFSLGYSNGEGLYLVTTQMLSEGGYEPESYWEYGFPAPLARGVEGVLEQGLSSLRMAGIQ